MASHFSLWGNQASRSFAVMRVETVESLTLQDPAKWKAIEDAAISRALRSFFTAIESADSLFAGEMLGSVVSGRMGGEGVTCAGDFSLRFRESKLADNRAIHFSLLEKLSELLKQAGSADSLLASLSLSGKAGSQSKTGALALQVRLEATGNSSEQAALRWGLGLAHVQQAVLFTSRYLRQQLLQKGDGSSL
jgi:hypothetical protein